MDTSKYTYGKCKYNLDIICQCQEFTPNINRQNECLLCKHYRGQHERINLFQEQIPAIPTNYAMNYEQPFTLTQHKEVNDNINYQIPSTYSNTLMRNTSYQNNTSLSSLNQFQPNYISSSNSSYKISKFI